MNEDEFNSAWGGEPDEAMIALQVMAQAQAQYFKALRYAGLSVVEAAAVIAASSAAYFQSYNAEEKQDGNKDPG